MRATHLKHAKRVMCAKCVIREALKVREAHDVHGALKARDERDVHEARDARSA